MATITGAISRQHLVDNRTQILMLSADVFLCVLSFMLAHFLRYDSYSQGQDFQTLMEFLPWVAAVRLPIFIYFGFYHTLIRYLTIFDIKKVFTGVAVSSTFLATFALLSGLPDRGYARGVFRHRLVLPHNHGNRLPSVVEKNPAASKE